MQDPVAHVSAGDELGDALGVRPARALVVEKEVSLAAKNLFRKDGAADRASEPASMPVRYRRDWHGLFILPSVAGEVVVPIILVSRTVPGVGAALGDDRHLHAGRVVEVGGLVRGRDFELFDAVDRGGHHTRGLAAVDPGVGAADGIVRIVEQSTGGIVAKIFIVNARTAVHVVAVVATVERENCLVHHRSGSAAVRAHASLHGDE